jgi:hypothetical protein
MVSTWAKSTGSLSGDEFDRVAREAACTAPPRENSGNQDIKKAKSSCTTASFR